MSDLNFDEIQFVPESVEDGFLELGDGGGIDDSVFDLPVEDTIDVNTTLKPKDSAEIAQQVEDTLISLMESGDTNEILALTGETISTVNISEDTLQNFGQMYAQAVLHNPAIRWYSKLINILPEDKFFIQGGSLNLKITPQVFKKVLIPFLGDFKYSNRQQSPITDLIYGVVESVKESELDGKMKKVLEIQKSKENVEDGLSVEDLNFEELAMDTTNAELEIDENDDMGGSSVVFTDNPASHISLRDLANKSIAEYCLSKGMVDEGSIRSKLVDEGFTRSRANEIIGIVKYISLNSGLKNEPTGNIGTGFANFEFE